MTEKINRLRELGEQKDRKAYLESLRSELTKQQRELMEKTERLRTVMEKEQKDVEALEKGGLTSLLHTLLGKREEKLQKQQREAREAEGEYQKALRELESVEQQLRGNENALAAVEACEWEYENLLNGLMSEVQSPEIETLNSRLEESKEELRRTEEAFGQIETVRGHLQEALRWVSTVSVENNEAARKRDKALLDARWGLNDLQKQVQLLKTEVKIYPTMISGIGSDALTGTAIIQIIKNTFGHLSQTETALQVYSEQTNIMLRRLEKQRDGKLIDFICSKRKESVI